MNVYQLVFSPTGGTQKVANYLTKHLSEQPVPIDLSDAHAEFDNIPFSAWDLVLVAVPVFGGRIPAPVVLRLQQMQGGGARAIAVVVYGNRAYEDALIELRDLLHAQDFRCIAGVAAVAQHSIVRHYAARRPDHKDQKQLEDFSQKISIRLAYHMDSEPAIPGNSPVYRPYAVIPVKPSTRSFCDKCGRCVKACPVCAISEDIRTDEERCISCMRCVHLCPNKARTIHPLVKASIAYKLRKVCSRRKENQLFV